LIFKKVLVLLDFKLVDYVIEFLGKALHSLKVLLCQLVELLNGIENID